MITIDLHNVELEKQVPYRLEAINGEIVATYDYSEEEDPDGILGNDVIKFPAGLDKVEFLKLVQEHNDVNEKLIPATNDPLVRADEENIALLDSLK